MMGWWITFAILFLLAILPLGVSVRFDAAGFRLRIVCGFIRLTVVPMPGWLKKKKPEKKAEQKPEKKKKPKEAPKDSQPEKKGGSLKDFRPLISVGLDFLGSFRKKLRVNYLQLRLIMAGGDPCDLAVNYGRAWAALGNLLPQLERFLVIKKRDLEVECDFTSEETRIIAALDLTITLGRLLSLAVVYGIRVLKEFMKLKKKNKNKAVQQNESEAS